MSIFQKSIVKKHISSENKEVLKAKWNLFTSYFHNATIQENIHNSKEEQFQEGFLRELFVKVLGYTLNPEPNFNLTTEYKNIKDSKKADGAIIINNTVTAVIELKGTATTDLGKVESQAFNYKNNQHQCLYVITSNFEKLRFYIDNAIEHIEFNLFKLTEEEFQLLYLCLAFKNIENNVPKNIKDESVSQEDVITKKLYNNYSLFKRELHHNLVALNPGNDAVELFQKSQKLLDRFLFIFFAEDRGLLPTNLIFRINKEWQQLREMRIEVSLYDRYKIYFSDLNVGAKVSLPAFSQTASNKKEEFQIYAYNGGLFKEDDELNTLKIDDELLFKHTEKLSNYDFASEVDVNILGHIFENSLNDVDELAKSLANTSDDPSPSGRLGGASKRKKDGVFYTPKYITKYIVDNTVGKLCTDKKVEFKILEEEYITDKKRNKTTIQNLAAKLSDYRNWLLQITICDPACGSGAFLNQALDFLINEHQYIDELQAKLFGDAIVMSDVEQSILENNLFGVDINEESVEIAKLSLWLRTAQPNRKLNDLNSNIKCGNSLIDDVSVAGDKAFNWNNEFSKIFDKGGFDVVIGNPPYVRVQSLKYTEIDFYKSKYKTAHRRVDISLLFFEKGLEILSANGLLSYISTIQFINAEYGRNLRELLLKIEIVEFIDYNGLPVFDGATTYPGIVSLKKSLPRPFNYYVMSEIGSEALFLKYKIKSKSLIDPEKLTDNVWILASDNNNQVLDKLQNNTIKLKDIANPCTGLTSGIDSVFILDENKVNEYNLEKEILLPVVRGRNLDRGFISEDLDYVIYPYKLSGNLTILLDENELENKYPKTYAYLLTQKDKLSSRKDSRKEISNNDWYKLVRKGKLDFFKSKKILTPGLSKNNSFAIDKLGLTYLCGGAGVFGLVQDKIDNNTLLAILNSKVVEFFLHSISTKKQGGYYSYLNSFLEEIPLPIKSNENISIYSLKYQKLKSDLFLLSKKMHSYILSRFNVIKLSSNLEKWHELSSMVFINELNKTIKIVKGSPLTKKDEFEWLELFEEKKQIAQTLKSQIDTTDKEIDQLVYKLYDLTEEEIAIVEKV